MKQEMFWVITMVLSGILMYSSFGIETIQPFYNATLSTNITAVYEPGIYTTPQIPWMGINMIFFILALLLGLFDMFDKYGNRFTDMREGVKFWK